MELSALAVVAIALVAVMLAMVASWLIKAATARVAAQLSDSDPELSRIRPKRAA